MKRLRLHTVILLCFLLLIPSFVFPEHVHAETYGVCQICHGSAKCGLCDPAKVPEGLGNGYLRCHYCDENGMRRCGTNTTGDGQRIGCDGSGYKEDGSVCEVCGGAGKYLCDACGGAKQFECRCRMNGYPGKCDVCYGTGWRTVDSQGQGINTAPVYPPDGATIDAGVWGRHEYFKYSTSRFGSGVTPLTAMSKFGATTEDEFYKVLRGADFSGSNSGGGQSDQQGGQDPQPGPDPGPDGNGSGNPYDVMIPSDEEITRKLKTDDMIYLLNRRVEGDRLMTIQIVMNALSSQERARVEAMTEEDVRRLRGDLEAMADGFRFSDNGAFDQVHIDPANTFIFTFDHVYELPCKCDLLIEIPELDFDTPHHVYRVDGPEVCEVGTPPELDEHEGVHYLIATSDRLGAFAFTDTAPVPTSAPQPGPEGEGQAEDAQGVQPQASVQNGAADPGQNGSAQQAPQPSDQVPAPQPTSQNNTVLLAVIAALAVVIVILLLMLIRKKR